MGEVYRPEDIIHERRKSVHDLAPKLIPQPVTPNNLDDILRDMESMKDEIAKIKQALRAHGIVLNE